MKGWGLWLLGAGVGAIAGAKLGSSALLLGLGAVVIGLFMVAAGRGSGGRDLIGDATAARAALEEGDAVPDESAEGADGRPRPTLAGLGGTVEQILRLAEEQAADHLAEAKAEAAEIVAKARAEADRINPP